VAKLKNRDVSEDKPTTNTEVCEVEIKVLKKGAKGNEVRAMQTLLIGYGFSCGSSGADGSFGPATDKAVRAYQAARGIGVDGSCGPKTWAKLLGVS
jgi:peptidoglycan hydrolase-like protein with peptidoglycan-binding domain